MCLRRSLENWNGHPLHFRRDNAHDSFGGAPIINYIIYHIVQLRLNFFLFLCGIKTSKGILCCFGGKRMGEKERSCLLCWDSIKGGWARILQEEWGAGPLRRASGAREPCRLILPQDTSQDRVGLQHCPCPTDQTNFVWLVNLLTSFIDAWNVTVKAFCLVQEFTSY